MGFQSIVNVKQTPGIPGDFYDNSPRRVQPGVISSAIANVGEPVFYSAKATDPTKVAGTDSAFVESANFAGILVNSKDLVRANGLTAGLGVAQGSVVSVCTMGRVWIKVGGAVTVGSTIYWDAATDSYSATASTGIEIGKAVIVNSAADGMAVVELG